MFGQVLQKTINDIATKYVIPRSTKALKRSKSFKKMVGTKNKITKRIKKTNKRIHKKVRRAIYFRRMAKKEKIIGRIFRWLRVI